jgi:hypothetical protein
MKGAHELQQLISEQSKEMVERMKNINWLLHPLGYRGSGRTYILALVYIKQAYESRFPIYIQDHMAMTTSNNGRGTIKGRSFYEITGQIKQIMKQLPSLDYTISQQAQTLTVINKKCNTKTPCFMYEKG